MTFSFFPHTTVQSSEFNNHRLTQLKTNWLVGGLLGFRAQEIGALEDIIAAAQKKVCRAGILISALPRHCF